MKTTHLEALLIRQEALRNKPYRCSAGKLTIGIGRNLDDNGITDEEAMFLCRNDLSAAAREVRQAFPWVMGIGRVRRAALVVMAFNLGLPRLRTFLKTLAAAESGDYRTAAKEMLDSRWATQVGARANELAIMMETDAWPTWLVRKFADG